jgi:hypothetical protein
MPSIDLGASPLVRSRHLDAVNQHGQEVEQ